MKNLIALCIALVCSTALHAETPQEGAKAIHALIEAKDYKTLFPTRYSEWHKVPKEGAKAESAMATLTKVFDQRRDVLLDLFKQLSVAEFEMGENEHAQESETGKTATAKLTFDGKEIPYTLYEMKGGKWGFHL